MAWRCVMGLKNFLKKVFGSRIELDRYLLEGDINEVAKKVADGLVPQQKKFSIFFDALIYFDKEALTRNAKKLADEVSLLKGRMVEYKDGKECGRIIRLNYTIADAQATEGGKEKVVIGKFSLTKNLPIFLEFVFFIIMNSLRLI